MFNLTTPAIKSALIAVSVTLSAFSLSAQAALTSITTSSGTQLVYSSVSDVTWTKDANLLGTWIASSTDNNANGLADIIDSIIAYSPFIINSPNPYSPTGIYQLSNYDFGSNGATSWFGALAFVNYLNSISYAGSNQWYLPTVDNLSRGFSTNTNGTFRGDESVELYYQELAGKPEYVYDNFNAYYQPDHGPKENINTFTHLQLNYYWAGTEYASDPFKAYIFDNATGYQNLGAKAAFGYAWAMTPGQVTAVPEPERVAMLLLGLGVIAGVMRRSRS